MATSKEYPNKGETYSNEDRKLIISLLDEYAQKLMNICEKIDNYRETVERFFLLLIGVTILLTASLSTFFPSWQSSTLVLSLLFVFLMIVLGLTIFKARQKIILLKRDAKTLAIKLEKVIRVTSQFQEHITTNFVTRIELDLRLADAESALQHYTGLIKRINKS